MTDGLAGKLLDWSAEHAGWMMDARRGQRALEDISDSAHSTQHRAGRSLGRDCWKAGHVASSNFMKLMRASGVSVKEEAKKLRWQRKRVNVG